MRKKQINNFGNFKLKSVIAIVVCMLLLTSCGGGQSTGDSNSNSGSEQGTAVGMENVDKIENGETVNIGEFSADTLDGKTLTHEYFANEKLTMINVWATFCGPCKSEMPDLGDLDRDLDDFQVLGIVTDVIDQDGNPDDDQLEVARALADASKVDYPSLILNRSLAELGFATLPSVPTTIFVDKDGNIVGEPLVGAYDGDSWKKIIEQKISELDK